MADNYSWVYIRSVFVVDSYYNMDGCSSLVADYRRGCNLGCSRRNMNSVFYNGVCIYGGDVGDRNHGHVGHSDGGGVNGHVGGGLYQPLLQLVPQVLI